MVSKSTGRNVFAQTTVSTAGVYLYQRVARAKLQVPSRGSFVWLVALVLSALASKGSEKMLVAFLYWSLPGG